MSSKAAKPDNLSPGLVPELILGLLLVRTGVDDLDLFTLELSVFELVGAGSLITTGSLVDVVGVSGFVSTTRRKGLAVSFKTVKVFNLTLDYEWIKWIKCIKSRKYPDLNSNVKGQIAYLGPSEGGPIIFHHYSINFSVPLSAYAHYADWRALSL